MAFANVYVLRENNPGAHMILKYDPVTPEWDVLNSDRPSNCHSMWPYLGNGHFLHCVGNTVPQYSANYGVTWNTASAPVGYTSLTRFDIMPGGTRVWGIWQDDADADTSGVFYSDDWGATWTLARVNIIPHGGIGVRPLVAVACHPNQANYVMAMGRTNLNACRIMYTTTGDTSWFATNDLSDTGGMASGNSGCLTWTPSDRAIIMRLGTTISVHDYSDLPFSSAVGVQGWAPADCRQQIPAGDGVYFALFDAIDTNAPLKRSTDYGESWESVGLPSGWSSFSRDDGAMAYDAQNDRLWVARATKMYYLSPTATGENWTDASYNYGALASNGTQFRGIIVTLDEPTGDGDDGSGTPATGHVAGGWRYVSPPLMRIPYKAPPRQVAPAPSRRPMQ